MSTVQEAASLFGSGLDEGSDPFRSVVNPSSNPVQESSPFSPPPPTSTNTNSTSVQGKVPTLNAHDYQPADDLFGGAPSDGTDDLFSAGGISDSDWLATGNANLDAGGTQGGYSDYSNHTHAGFSGTVNQSQGRPGYEQVQQQQHYQAYGNSGCYLRSLWSPFLLTSTFSLSESLRFPKPICGSEFVSATRFALSVLHIMIMALTAHRAAQSSTYPGQGYNYGPTSQHSAYASPQQTTTHLKSATWNPVSDAYDPYKPNQATTQSNFYSPPTQSTYDPYKPSTTSNPPTQSAYDPYKTQVQQAPPVHTTHDQYKPTVQAGSSIQSRPTPAYGALNSSSTAYSKPPVPPVPVPSRVTAESFRTNSSNAYDPPLLPTKTKRHASGWGPTTTSSIHAPSFPPSPPVVSNTPLAPPRRDTASVGPPTRTDIASAGPPPRRVDSPAHQGNIKSPGVPPPPSRPSSRQVSRGTGASRPPPLPSSKQILAEPTVQSPQQHGYTHQRGDSPGPGTQRNWTASPEFAKMSPEHYPEEMVPQPERPPAEQDHETPSFDDYSDPEALSVDANEITPITRADTFPGLSRNREGGPGPSTARQPDYVTHGDDEIGGVTVTDIPQPERQPISSPHSRANSYDRLRVNDKLASPPRHIAPPPDPYRPTGSTVQHPPPASQFVPPPTQVTSTPYNPYKPTVPSTLASVPGPTPSSPPVNGHGSRPGSRPGSLRSSLESTRPHVSQHDYTPPVRSSSPASIRSQPGTYVSSALKSEYGSSPYDPYAPSNRKRSATSGTVSSVTSDAYTPRRQSSEAQDHTSYGSKFGHPDRPSSRADTLLVTSTYPTYAPSPSLLGTNDPLGRSSARVPVISFGFGGKVATCFHGADMSSAGFDVALSSRQSREIHIRSLQKLIPQSALEDSTVVYPGPLFGDSGSPTVSLVRGASAQAKTKKAKVIKYLEDRISELSNVVAYASTGLLGHGGSEGKLALFSLLKVLVENDGKLNGT